ncbi:UNVERIFIED_CONTAM: SET domain-containing protein 4, partial [Siphonaria sp. JEL0065]
TGRGLMATKDIPAGSSIISVSAKFLITINTVFEYFSKSRDIYQLNEQAALALFLAAQRKSRPINGIWNAYLDMIPKNFNTVAANLPIELLKLLPWQVQEMARKQVETFEKDYEAVVALLSARTEDSDIPIEKGDYHWAWYAVNTRCITLNTSITAKSAASKKLGLGNKKKASKPTPKIALAPFLDLLNHSLTAKINANFNPKTDAFEIIALETVEKGQECFISYGAHDNAFLLAEYGFVITDLERGLRDGQQQEWWIHNPYDHVVLDREVVGLLIPEERKGFRERVMGELEGTGLFG